MKNRTKKLVLSALFCSAVLIATAVFPFPLGNGYANIGDTLVLISSLFIGPLWGFFAAGLGSALADVILSFGVYAPVTFVIKGLMAVVFYYISRPFTRTKAAVPMSCVAAIAAEAIMVLGYLSFELLVYSPAGALPNVPANLIQGAVSVLCTTLLVSLFSTNKYLAGKSGSRLGLII